LDCTEWAGAIQEVAHRPAVEPGKLPEGVSLARRDGSVQAVNAVQFLDLTLPTLAENLALDEALLLEAEDGRGGEVLRFWEWPSAAVVLGAGCRLADDVDEAACRADGVPVLRRASGGGTVLLGPGCLCYSLVLAYARAAELRDITASYGYILGRVAAALRGLLPDAEHAGTSDLASGGRKFSGNAQQRKRDHLLHHGTLLYDFDLDRVGRYLRMPARQPEYRGRREHAAFLQNLPCGADELRHRLRETWGADALLPDWPSERTGRLAAEKYTRGEWIGRR
jgi:lipoate---protein ligase